MRKALGLAILGCALVLGFACSGESTTPTEPAVSPASNLQTVTGAIKPDKDLICHYNSADDPYGVIVEVSAKNAARHAGHIADNLDCEFVYDFCWDPKDTCTYSQCDDLCF